jgi:4a-hydroxytetrahydrobiopterin dehydratase
MSDTTQSVSSPFVITPLKDRRCSAKASPITPAQIAQWIQQTPGWQINAGVLSREFHFKNFFQTMGFVNAIAWIAHVEDHHPDLAVSYNRCVVSFSTHSVGGLSENDFICAAKVDQIPLLVEEKA